MRLKFTLLLTASILFFSCSDDKEDADATNAQHKIYGTWDVSELKIDEDDASNDARFGSAILSHMINKNCTLITLTFNSDMTLEAKNSVNYLEVDLNATGLGFQIPCPTAVDSETTTYTFDGTTLTFVNSDDKTVTVKPIIIGDVMTIAAADLGYDKLNVEGDLVFTKRE